MDTITCATLERLAQETKRGKLVDCSTLGNSHPWTTRDYEQFLGELIPENAAFPSSWGVPQDATPAQAFEQVVAVLTQRHGAPLLGADVPCGGGYFVGSASARTPVQWFGVDHKNYMQWCLGSQPGLLYHHDDLKVALSNKGEITRLSEDRFFLQDAADMSAIPDNSFHLLVSVCGLQYMHEPRAIEEMYRILRPGGVMLLDVGVPTVYAFRNTTREAEFQKLNAQGYRFDMLRPSEELRNNLLIEKTKDVLRFPACLTDDETRYISHVGYGDAIGDGPAAIRESLHRIRAIAGDAEARRVGCTVDPGLDGDSVVTILDAYALGPQPAHARADQEVDVLARLIFSVLER